MGAAYDKGLILYRQGRHRMAADEFRKELSERPGNVGAQSMLALALVYDGKRTEALAEARAAVAAGPQRAFAHYALASVIIGKWPIKSTFASRLFSVRNLAEEYKSRLSKARAPAMEAVRLAPMQADYLALMSAIELDQGHHQIALTWADRGLESSPDHLQCTNLRARALTKLGRNEEAKQTAAGALQINPEHATSHATRGWAMLHNGEPENALEHFTEAMRLNPEDRFTRRGYQRAKWANMPVLRPIARIAPWAFSRRAVTIMILAAIFSIGVGLALIISPNRGGGNSHSDSSTNDTPLNFPSWIVLIPATVFGVRAMARRRDH